MNANEIINAIYSDKFLNRLRKKIDSGKGSFKDTFAYCDRAADLLGSYLSDNVLSMADEERITTCIELLRDRHKDINDLMAAVQATLDAKKNISIAMQHAPFDEARAEKIGVSLTDKTVPESTIKRRAKSATATATRSMHDDNIEANSKFRAKAGLQCYITRTTDGSCCPWCTSVAGRYEFGSQPAGIFRRHDNCKCTIDYDGQKLRGKATSDGRRSKTWEEVPKNAGAEKKIILSKEKAQQLNDMNNAEIKRRLIRF